MKPALSSSVLRQRLATRHGLHAAREPREFLYAAEIIGLTPGALGHDAFAVLLHYLRREAGRLTMGDFALAPVRDPQTHERLGYTVHTHDQTTANQIAAVIQSLFT